MTPDLEVAILLFGESTDTVELKDLFGDLGIMNVGGFAEMNWLNTPGPMYTTITDNCGTGQPAAMNNVGADEDGREVIFKQPLTMQQLKETFVAAVVDPFDNYYFDGGLHWNRQLIIDWWSKSEERINYIIDLYKTELNLPITPRYHPIPENYKNWLDFYQHGMKEYLEWYIMKLGNEKTVLDELNFDWTRKEQFDQLLYRN